MGSRDVVYPGRCQVVAFAVLLILVLAAPLSSAAQIDSGNTQPSDTVSDETSARDASRYTLSGSVVNSAMGEPIRRALVSAIEDGAAVLTDSRGRFELPGVRGGTVHLLVTKPGYFFGMDIASDGGTTVEVTADTPPLVLKLAPPAIISGQVLDGDDQPVVNAEVVVLQYRMVSGLMRMMRQTVTQQFTDVHGHFRIDTIPAGKYLIAVAESKKPRLLETGVPNGREGVFPMLYYPGTTDSTKAQTVTLGAGEQFQAAFSVSYEPTYRISGRMTGLGPEGSVAFYRQTGAGSDYQLGVTPGSGDFACRLPAGSYLALSPAGFYSASTVEVSADRAEVRVAMGPMPSVPVRLHYEGSAAERLEANQSPMSYLALIGKTKDLGLNPIWRSNIPEFSRVTPGEYDLEVSPFGPWRVKSARFGGTDVLEERLVVRPSTASEVLDIVLTDDAATLRVGIPSLPDRGDDKQGIRQVARISDGRTAILLRRDGAGRRVRYVAANSRNTEIGNLVPGDYDVVAIALDAWVPSQDVAALDRLFAAGQRVHLDPKATASVTLALGEGGN